MIGCALLDVTMPALTRGPQSASDECWLGLEGIVSKRLDSPYRSGPSKVWLKSKNPASETVRREGEEDWN